MLRAVIILIGIVFPAICFSNNFWGQPNITQPQHYIFGYGSLVNSESRAASLECMRSVVAARISAKFGYKRGWNYSGPGFTALGLEKTDQPMSINGIIYAVQGEDMKVWDRREKNYERVEVPWELVESVDWMKLPTEGKLWIYVPKNSNNPSPQYPLLQSYIDTCVSGFLEYSEEFAIEFLQTTDGWSKFWLNDRLLARRPWVHFKKYSCVDDLLEKYPEAGNYYQKRSYVSEWV